MSTTLQPHLEEVIGQIAAPPEAYLAQAKARLDTLTKPLGSLGRLEDLAAQWFAIRRGNVTGPVSKAVYVFAADHGITAEGVSAYPAQVTQQMVLNFLSGGAAINVLARLNQVEVNVIDVGVDADLAGHAGLAQYKVRRGSRNMLREPAMSEEELDAALSVGLTLADAAFAKGNNLIAVGEMGIGNTTAASVMTAALTGMPASLVTGKGTGLDSEAYDHKCRIVEAVVSRHFAAARGAAGNSSLCRRPGDRRHDRHGAGRGPAANRNRHGWLYLHRGRGHRLRPGPRGAQLSLRRTSIAGARPSRAAGASGYFEPILDLDMRLGEGTGAVLAMPILEAALRLYREMATFASAGVSGANA